MTKRPTPLDKIQDNRLIDYLYSGRMDRHLYLLVAKPPWVALWGTLAIVAYLTKYHFAEMRRSPWLAFVVVVLGVAIVGLYGFMLTNWAIRRNERMDSPKPDQPRLEASSPPEARKSKTAKQVQIPTEKESRAQKEGESMEEWMERMKSEYADRHPDPEPF